MPNTKVTIVDNDNTIVKEYNSVKDFLNNENISEYEWYNIKKNDFIYNNCKIILEDHKQYTKAICDYCGKEFDCQKWRIENHKNIFCCKNCETEFRKSQTKPNLICPICGKPFYIKPSRIEKAQIHYCSKECFYKAKEIYMKGEGNHQFGLKGDKNASWISDRKISHYGYILIRRLDHPFRNCDGFVFEHRLVAEKYLLNSGNSIEIDGKLYLKDNYVVHHIDFDRQNNNIENLVIIDISEHMKLHFRLRDKTELEKYCLQYNLNINNVIENSIKYKYYSKYNL